MPQNGRRNEIKIDTNDKIKDLKIRSGFPNSFFLFQGEILEDDKTVKDYGIEDDDIILLNNGITGGEVGSSIKGFTDPKKVGPIRYSTITDGPDYLIVKDGINLFGYCKNKNCIAYKKEVCSPFGLELSI